jgi:hypothetical protein
MSKLVKLELTDTDCLSLRLALNAHAMEWGDKASVARKAGDDVDAATCERVRSDYHRLWDMVNEAQEAPGRVQDWIYRRPAPADDVARRQRNTADACAHKPEARPIGTDPVDVLNAIDRLKGW